MSRPLNYSQWTAKTIALHVVEAAETLMLCPSAQGPAGYRNAMPVPVRRQTEAYGTQSARFRRRPAPGAISRMEKTWEWINAIEGDDDRTLLYEWARVKCARSRTIGRFARERGMSERELRGEIRRICSCVADRLNGMHLPLTAREDLSLADPTDIPEPQYRREKPNVRHWIGIDLRPRIDHRLSKSRTVSR